MRHNGLDFWDNPYDISNPLSIFTNCGVLIPMSYNGTTLIFNTRVPTKKELSNCVKIQMTSDAPWNPDKVKLGKLASDSVFSPQVPHVKRSILYLSSQDTCFALKSTSLYEDAYSN